jgi:hypothetical protein
MSGLFDGQPPEARIPGFEIQSDDKSRHSKSIEIQSDDESSHSK